MAVYIDQLQPSRKAVRKHPAGTEWCHLIADTEEELHIFAEAIGLQRRWFQNTRKPGRLPHYDLTAGMRMEAVKYGAREVLERKAWVTLHARTRIKWGLSVI